MGASGLGDQKIEQRAGKGGGPFQVGEMRGVEDDGAGAGDSGGERLAVAGPRHGHIAVPADDERGDANLLDKIALIHVADGGAAAGVTDGIGSEKYVANGGDGGVAGGAHARGETALDGDIGDGRHAVFQHDLAAGAEDSGVGHTGGSVGEREGDEALRGARAEPKTDHAAERKAAVGEAAPGGGDIGGSVYRGEQVASELFDGVVAGGRGGGSMAAQIDAEHLKMAQEGGDLGVPEPVVGAKGMREDEERSVGGAIETVVDAGGFGVGEGHGTILHIKPDRAWDLYPRALTFRMLDCLHAIRWRTSNPL